MSLHLSRFRAISVIILSFLAFSFVTAVYAGSDDQHKSAKQHNSYKHHGNPLYKLFQKIEALEARVDELEQGGGSGPQEIAVDCTAGDTVTDALASVADSSTPVTITISGVCMENVEIHRNNVTLQGGSTADGIDGSGDPAKNTLLVVGGLSNIVINNLSLSGGVGALAVAESSSVFASGALLSNASLAGLLCFTASSCILFDVDFEDNQFGILAYGSAAVTMAGGSITNAAIVPFSAGIIASGTSTITLDTTLPALPAVLAPPLISNYDAGISAAGGDVYLNAAVIQDVSIGVYVAPGGSLRREVQSQSATIQNYSFAGIFVNNMGIVSSIGSQDLNVTGTGTSYGIFCEFNSTFELDHTDVLFSNNASDLGPGCP